MRLPTKTVDKLVNKLSKQPLTARYKRLSLTLPKLYAEFYLYEKQQFNKFSLTSESVTECHIGAIQKKAALCISQALTEKMFT